MTTIETASPHCSRFTLQLSCKLVLCFWSYSFCPLLNLQNTPKWLTFFSVGKCPVSHNGHPSMSVHLLLRSLSSFYQMPIPIVFHSPVGLANNQKRNLIFSSRHCRALLATKTGWKFVCDLNLYNGRYLMSPLWSLLEVPKIREALCFFLTGGMPPFS